MSSHPPTCLTPCRDSRLSFLTAICPPPGSSWHVLESRGGKDAGHAGDHAVQPLPQTTLLPRATLLWVAQLSHLAAPDKPSVLPRAVATMASGFGSMSLPGSNLWGSLGTGGVACCMRVLGLGMDPCQPNSIQVHLGEWAQGTLQGQGWRTWQWWPLGTITHVKDKSLPAAPLPWALCQPASQPLWSPMAWASGHLLSAEHRAGRSPHGCTGL